MRPKFNIIADGTDITDKINDRLLSLSLQDAAGITSDTVEIRLDNRGRTIALPSKGASLQVYIGYDSSGLVYRGVYTVDELTLSGPPHSMTIKGKAADMISSLKAPRSTSYAEGITISALVKELAARHNLTPKISSELANISLGHVDQTSESDLNLLTRLAKEHRAVAKPANDCLLFVKEGEAKSASGQSVTTTTVDLSIDGGSYIYTSADRQSYGSVTASYRDVATNKDVKIKISGSNAEGPDYSIRNSYPNAIAATAGAKAKLATLTCGTAKLSLNGIIGKPTAMAEGGLIVKGVHPEVDTLSWIIKKTSHSLSESGFTTSIEAEIQ